MPKYAQLYVYGIENYVKNRITAIGSNQPLGIIMEDTIV